MLRPLAFIFGVIFFVMGFFGFTNTYMMSGNLFGIFRLNFEAHIVHMGGGVLGILTSLYSTKASKLFFIFVGLVSALFAFGGYTQEGDMIFGMFSNNHADTIAYTILAVVSLTLGFSKNE